MRIRQFPLNPLTGTTWARSGWRFTRQQHGITALPLREARRLGGVRVPFGCKQMAQSLAKCTNPCLCIVCLPFVPHRPRVRSQHRELGSLVGKLLQEGVCETAPEWCRALLYTFFHERGPFWACRSAWCDGCCRKHPDDNFRVAACESVRRHQIQCEQPCLAKSGFFGEEIT